jgi:hypothetical protein
MEETNPLNPKVDFGKIFTTPQESVVTPTYLPPSRIPLDKGVPDAFFGQLVAIPQDREYSTQQLQWLAAEDQTWYGNLGRFAANTAISGVGSVLKTPGDIYAAVTDDYNNAWLNAINSAQEAIKPTGYLSEEASTGSLMDKFTSGSYWATTVADTLGIALSFFVPGAALRLANVGGRITNGLTKLAQVTKGTEAANAVKTALTATTDLKALTSSKAANKAISTILGSEFSGVGLINNAAALATNTALEAMAGGTEIYNSTKENLLATQPELGEEEIERRATLAAKINTAGNTPILLLSNLVFNRLIFDKLGSTSLSLKTLIKAIDDDAVRASLKQTVGKALNPVKAVRNLLPGSSNVDGWLTQRIVGGFMSEGFLEEFQQTALERQLQDSAANNTLNSEMTSPLDAIRKTFSGEFFDYINKYGGYNPAKLLTADAQQMEAFILGGLISTGFVGGRAVLGKEIAAYNSSLFGTEAKQRTRFAKTFGAKDLTKTDGLFSVIKKIQDRKYFDISPEQYKEAFLNDKGRFDVEKAQTILMESADSKMRYAAKKALMLQNRALKLKEAPDEVTRAILEEQFVADDLLDHFGELLIHEHGYELFSRVVDDSIKSQSDQIKEYTGDDISATDSQQYAESLKRIAKSAHKAARQAFLNHDNRTELVAPGLLPQELRTGGTKADRMMYRSGLMQARISLAVKTATLGEQLKNLNSAVESASSKTTEIDAALSLLETQQKALLDTKAELDTIQKELKRTSLKGNDKYTSINRYKLAQKALGIDVTDEQAALDLKARQDELKAQEAALKEIVESEENKPVLTEIQKQRRLKEDTSKINDYLTKKAAELNAILNGVDGFTPAEFNKTNNFIAAYTGKSFNGLKDLQDKLWDDYFIEEDYKNYLKNTQATRDAAEKQRILDKIESNKLASIFNNLTEVSVVSRTINELDEEGEVKGKQDVARNFYFSAPITVEVLNDTRSARTTEINGTDLSGSFRIVKHVSTENAADEALILRSDINKNVFVKIKADGSLEVHPVGLDNIILSYKEFEYSLSAPGIANLNVTTEITDAQKNIISQAIDEHKDKVSLDAFETALTELKRRYSGEFSYREPFTAYQATAVQRLNALTYAMRKVSAAMARNTQLNVEGIRVNIIKTAIQTDNLQKLLTDLQNEYDDLLESAADDINFLEEFGSVDVATGYDRFLNYIEKLKTFSNDIKDNQSKIDDLRNRLDNLTSILMQREEVREIVTKLGISFPYQRDIKAMTEILNKFSSISNDDQALQELLDEPDIANSTFVKNIKSQYTTDATINYPEIREFLENVDGDLRKFIEAVKAQSKDRGFATYAFKEALTFNQVLRENLNDFQKANSVFEQLRSSVPKKEVYQKYEFAIEDIDLKTGRKVHTEANPYSIPNAVDLAEKSTWAPTFNSEYGLLRTGGSEFQAGDEQADTFYGKYKQLITTILEAQRLRLTELLNSEADPVLKVSLQAQLTAVTDKLAGTPSQWTKTMMDFDIDEVKAFVNAIPDSLEKQQFQATVSQFYYYAWSKIFNPGLNTNTGIALVTVHNVEQLPETLRNKVYFYEPKTGSMLNIDGLRQLDVDLNSITDVKAIVINNVQNPEKIDYTNESTYYLDPKLDNELIYASIRDYSSATIESIKEDFDTSNELARIKSTSQITDEALKELAAQNILNQQIQTAIDDHKTMRQGLLTAVDRNLITTVKGFAFKSPGYLRDGISQEVEVTELFTENETLTEGKIQVPWRAAKNSENSKQKNAELRKKYGAKKVGFWYVEANGTSTLIRPRTLAQTNEVDKFMQLIAYAANPKNDKASKQAVINYLHDALYVRGPLKKGSKAYQDYFAFRFSADSGTIINLQIGNTKISGEDIANPQIQNELRRHLSGLYHNLKSKKISIDNASKEFTSYEVDADGNLKSTKHENYLSYLFKNSNSSLNKGFVKSNKMNDNGVPIKPTKLVFNSARQDIYFYLADPTKLTSVKIDVATTEQSSTLADMKLPKDDSSYATVNNKTLTVVTYTYSPSQVVLADFDANNDEAFAKYLLSGKLSQAYDKEVTIDGKKEFDQADFNFLEGRSKFKVTRGNNVGHYFQLLSLNENSVILRYYTPTSVENKMISFKELETLINTAEQLGELSIEDLNIINTLDKQFEDEIDQRLAAANQPTPNNTTFKVGDLITFTDLTGLAVEDTVTAIVGDTIRTATNKFVKVSDAKLANLQQSNAQQPAQPQPTATTNSISALSDEDVEKWSVLSIIDGELDIINGPILNGGLPPLDADTGQEVVKEMLTNIKNGSTVDDVVNQWLSANTLGDELGSGFVKLLNNKISAIESGQEPPDSNSNCT